MDLGGGGPSFSVDAFQIISLYLCLTFDSLISKLGFFVWFSVDSRVGKEEDRGAFGEIKVDRERL